MRPGASGFFPPLQALKPTFRQLSVEPSYRFSRLQGIDLFRVRCQVLRPARCPHALSGSPKRALQGIALVLCRPPLPAPAALAFCLKLQRFLPQSACVSQITVKP